MGDSTGGSYINILMVLPNFGQVFMEFSTPAESRRKKNRALFLFCAFCAIAAGFLAFRGHLSGDPTRRRTFSEVYRLALG